MAALVALDADILGLIELENSEGVEPLAAIVDGLNAINGPGTYAYINTGNIGTDTIKVGIIYKPSKASPLHAHAIIDSSVDPRFVDTLNRPSLAQSFVENSTGEVMTLVVNHLKSKGCGWARPAATSTAATARAAGTRPAPRPPRRSSTGWRPIRPASTTTTSW